MVPSRVLCVGGSGPWWCVQPTAHGHTARRSRVGRRRDRSTRRAVTHPHGPFRRRAASGRGWLLLGRGQGSPAACVAGRRGWRPRTVGRARAVTGCRSGRGPGVAPSPRREPPQVTATYRRAGAGRDWLPVRPGAGVAPSPRREPPQVTATYRRADAGRDWLPLRPGAGVAPSPRREPPQVTATYRRADAGRDWLPTVGRPWVVPGGYSGRGQGSPQSASRAAL